MLEQRADVMVIFLKHSVWIVLKHVMSLTEPLCASTVCTMERSGVPHACRVLDFAGCSSAQVHTGSPTREKMFHTTV